MTSCIWNLQLFCVWFWWICAQIPHRARWDAGGGRMIVHFEKVHWRKLWLLSRCGPQVPIHAWHCLCLKINHDSHAAISFGWQWRSFLSSSRSSFGSRYLLHFQDCEFSWQLNRTAPPPNVLNGNVTRVFQLNLLLVRLIKPQHLVNAHAPVSTTHS